MSKKLIFLDIDGTVTVAGENVPPVSAIEAIRKTQAKGNLVFLCTGRNLGMLAPLLKYGFDGVIGCGGGIVQVGNTIIYDKPMPKEQFKEIMEVLKRNGVFRTIEAKDVTYGDENLGDFLNSASGVNSEIERWRKALSSQLDIRPMSEYDGRNIYKVVIMCERAEQLQEAREHFEKDYVFAIQEVQAHSCQNGDLVNRAFDKGQAIQRVCDYFQIGMENTYGFGDSMNDVEMIQVVNTSVCMANGAKALKEMSDYIAPSVEDDGLYKMFKKLNLI